MIKRISKKTLLYLALSASLMGSSLTAYAEDVSVVTKEYEFQSAEQYSNGDEYFDATMEQDGNIYTLSGITTDVVKEEKVEGEYLYYDSPTFIDETSVEKPAETMEQNGKTYRLKEFVLQEAIISDRTQYVEAEVVLNSLEWLENVPQTSEIEVSDESTGQSLTTTMPFIKVKSQEETWVDTFEFPITVSGYDANYFMLGKTKVEKNDDLSNYKKEFLSLLGLPSNKYKISEIKWNGEPFTKSGSLCRTATAYGEKLTYNVVAIYGGEAILPAAEGYKYYCTYVNEDQPDSVVYTIKATASYEYTPPVVSEESSLLDTIMEWIKANPIAAFGIGTLFVIGFILLILFMMSKKKEKKKEEANKVDIIDMN